MNRLFRNPDFLGALFVFAITNAVYIATLTVGCPFWDSGEYIATSYTLGVPHPPGTPLYVLIGRVFSMLPFFELVATRVNYLSALSSSVCASFTYLITVEIYRRWVDRGDLRLRGRFDSDHQWIAFFSGCVAAFFCAFSRTFWDNAIEAEVYALSSMIMAIAVWIILRWARPGEDREHRTGLFVLLYYLACLSMGIHLGTFLVLPSIILYALLVDRNIFGQTPVGAVTVAGLLILMHPGLLPILGWKLWMPLIGGVLVLSLISLGMRLTGGKELHPALGARGLFTWCCLAAILGISSHAYLILRANLDPLINEADPSTWDALWKVLTRDQYKPPNPFEFRQAPWSIQFTRHFLDYAKDQYSLGMTPPWLWNIAPYLLGLGGAVLHFFREKKSFILMATMYLVMTVGLVFYLNFREDEVRARDYFFVASFQFFAIWIGLGAAGFLRQFRGAESEGSSVGLPSKRFSSPLLLLAGVLTVLLPILTCKNYWHSHDRTEFWVAADYAYNMLTPLEENAILFTNGDNDTFPLWYIQEVEGLRPDVRVVNLSLLNTGWYLKQVRDYEPTVDLGWDDETIQDAEDFSIVRAMAQEGYYDWTVPRLDQWLRSNGLRPYVRDLQAQLITKDIVVARIVEQEYGQRPLYIAVTVPDAMGLEERMVMEGLVFRIVDPEPGNDDRIDVEKTLDLMTNVYRYRGILNEDGTHDESVYKHLNATRLVQNYAAAFIRAADDLYSEGENERALGAIQMAVAIAPDSPRIRYSLGVLYLRSGEYERAEEVWLALAREGYEPVRVLRYLGRTQEVQEKFDAAEMSYRASAAADPSDFDSMRELFSYLWEVRQQYETALAVMQEWLQQHPEDRQMLAVYREFSDSLARMQSP